MRLIQDKEGRWIGRPAFARKVAGNRPPVTLDDAVTAEIDGPSILIDVMTNDFDPEGGALTLSSAFAAIGTATVEGTRVRYTPPPGFEGVDTVVYEIADDQGATRSGQANVTVAQPALDAIVTAENLIEVTAASAVIDIVVTTPAEFAGTFDDVDLAALATGPVNLVPPGVTGGTTLGATLTAKAGLWVHDAGEDPVRSWGWTRDGVTIAGATGATRIIAAEDQGTTLAAVETLSDGYGARAATSMGIAAQAGSFTPDQDANLLGWWDADDATTLTLNGSEVSDWADKAGSATLSQTLPSWRPTTGSRTLNGRNILDFSGGTQHLFGPVSLPASGDVALHMVAEIDSLSSEYAALVAVEATRDFQLDAGAANQFDGRLNVAGIGTTTALSGGPFVGAVIVSILFDRTGTAEAEVFVNGVSRATMALTDALDATQALHVMTNRSKNAGVDGGVAEILLTGSISNRVDHHDYLATKWGLS